jgi:hypothetical protein
MGCVLNQVITQDYVKAIFRYVHVLKHSLISLYPALAGYTTGIGVLFHAKQLDTRITLPEVCQSFAVATPNIHDLQRAMPIEPAFSDCRLGPQNSDAV